MDIFDILTMIGGLCLFLFGMTVMGDALERAAGNSLLSSTLPTQRSSACKITNSRPKEFSSAGFFLRKYGKHGRAGRPTKGIRRQF